jgi:hypothetical protein
MLFMDKILFSQHHFLEHPFSTVTLIFWQGINLHPKTACGDTREMTQTS